MRIALLGVGVLFLTLSTSAQTTSTTRSITAVGNATVSATPDQATVDVGVSTQASTAQEASTQNATQVGSVIAGIQTVLGANANIKTISYSLSPVYSNATVNQSAQIIGYMATNIVEATITDLTLIGKVIDAGIAAGANNVQGVQFSLQNPDPVQAQALKTAAASALSQANAIAAGLNLHTGNVLHASEGVNTVYPVLSLAPGAAAAPTPVKPGLIQVQGSVTIEVEITQ